MESIRVLQMWKTDFRGAGGGAIAMNRLNGGLRAAGIESKMFCLGNTTGSVHTITFRPNRFIRKLESGLKRLCLRQGLHDIYLMHTPLMRFHPAFRWADVIHIHGTHGFINYLLLPLLTLGKTVVYTLHDMWPYTGHCGFSYDCARWLTGCGQCPYPDTHPAIRKDNTRLEWHLKKKVYQLTSLTIVALSTMKTRETQQSLLGRFPVYHIPNGLDTTVYRPVDRGRARLDLGLSDDRIVLMFSALSLIQHRKGGDLLIKALRQMPERLKAKTVLLTIGDGNAPIVDNAGIETLNLGFVHDEHHKVRAYSAADLFVSPSRGETLPLVLQESAACGTPMVAFDVGGVPDIVKPEATGYLARPEDPGDLCKGIMTLMDNDHLRRCMGASARQLIQREFTIETQVKRHIALYKDLLKNRHRSSFSGDYLRTLGGEF